MDKRVSRLASALFIPLLLASLLVFAPCVATAAPVQRSASWIESSDTNGVASRIDVFTRNVGTAFRPSYSYEIYLPGAANPAECFLSWNGDAQAIVDGVSYASGECPIPAVGATATYTFTSGDTVLGTYSYTTYQGSPNVQAVFIEIDESDGKPTIADMDGDPDHEVTCSGTINIDGTWYKLSKMKGRGNSTWSSADDKRPYNVTLKDKINWPGIDSPASKKWSFLAEIFDRSLLTNRTGFSLAHEIGVGQDTVSADVWMNGEYQGCYTITPKTDSFVTKDGYMIEQDNYLEDSVDEGGDPQFSLNGLREMGMYAAGYNRITVKKIGDNLLKVDGQVDDSPANLERVSLEVIRPWLQDMLDAILSTTGYNSKGKHYSDYIDMESFAKVFLMQEYVKNLDAHSGSMLFYRAGSGDEDKLIAGPIWDLDNGFGCTTQGITLGTADDRINGDRRSAEGDFIVNLSDIKTSIFKALSKHDDFMLEVYRQYNLNRAAFDNLPSVIDGMAAEIEASAKMNFAKVNTISTDTHKYARDTTFGSGQYRQDYLSTSDPATNWQNCVANLRTYCRVRSLWFANRYGLSASGGWALINGAYYYLVDYVAIANGWVADAGKWCYIQNYRAVVNGWVADGGAWYYIKDYYAVANGWVKDGGAWYCIKNYAAVANGWVKDSGAWYYIKNYALVTNSWVQYGGKWYYMGSSGALATNTWLQYKGSWYYLNGSGNPVANGWIQYKGSWYHFNASGVCDRVA